MKTCYKGHVLDVNNKYVTKLGNIRCRACANEGYNRRYQAKRDSKTVLMESAPLLLSACKDALNALEANHHLVTNSEERMISVTAQATLMRAILKAENKRNGDQKT